MSKELRPEVPGTPDADPHAPQFTHPDTEDRPAPAAAIEAACAIIQQGALLLDPVSRVVLLDALRIIRDNAALMDKHTLEAMTFAAETDQGFLITHRRLRAQIASISALHTQIGGRLVDLKDLLGDEPSAP